MAPNLSHVRGAGVSGPMSSGEKLRWLKGVTAAEHGAEAWALLPASCRSATEAAWFRAGPGRRASAEAKCWWISRRRLPTSTKLEIGAKPCACCLLGQFEESGSGPVTPPNGAGSAPAEVTRAPPALPAAAAKSREGAPQVVACAAHRQLCVETAVVACASSAASAASGAEVAATMTPAIVQGARLSVDTSVGKRAFSVFETTRRPCLAAYRVLAPCREAKSNRACAKSAA